MRLSLCAAITYNAGSPIRPLDSTPIGYSGAHGTFAPVAPVAPATQAIQDRQVRHPRAAGEWLDAHAALHGDAQRQAPRRLSEHADRVGLPIPGKPAGGAAPEDLPGHLSSRPSEEEREQRREQGWRVLRTDHPLGNQGPAALLGD